MADGYGTTVGLLAPFAVGRGYPQVKRVAQPAAGAGFSYQVTQGAVENLRAVRFQLVTSAAVANRVPRLELQDGDASVVLAIEATAAQAASLTDSYLFLAGVGVQLTGASGRIVLPLPDVFTPPGFAWVLTVGAVDAADQVSGVQVFTELFPEGPTGEPQGPVTTSQPIGA